MAVSRINEAGLNVNQYGNRNLIINGAMQVDQRGLYTITTTGSPEYGGPDRFFMWSYTSSEQVIGDVSQSTDVPTGNGFGYSRKFDVTTAESAVAVNEALVMSQFIEAQNLQHLEYGTSSAKEVTMSFWIKSTKTGTYCFFINQEDGSRIYVKEYTVDASDTWEKKIITIPGDASGTINNDNGRGFWVGWVLMAGSDRHGTANAWRATDDDYATSNQVNAVDSTSNNIYLTGVQLEVGDTATDFEHRTFGDEEQRCQRYYYRMKPINPSGGVAHAGAFNTHARSSTELYGVVHLPTSMRTTPSIAISATGDMNAYHAATTLTVSSFTINGMSTAASAEMNVSVSSGATAGNAGWIRINKATGYIEFNSEL